MSRIPPEILVQCVPMIMAFQKPPSFFLATPMWAYVHLCDVHHSYVIHFTIMYQQLFYFCFCAVYSFLRTERDRGLLQSKLRAAQRTQNTSSQPVPSAYVATVVREQPQPQGGGVGSAVPQSVLQSHADQVHQLKSKIVGLETEV